MNLRLSVLVISVAVILQVAAQDDTVEVKEVTPNPNYPGQCYDEVTQTAYAVGNSWNVKGQCIKKTCQSNNNKLSIKTEKCFDVSIVKGDPYCWVTKGNTAQPYPYCCSSIVCA